MIKVTFVNQVFDEGLKVGWLFGLVPFSNYMVLWKGAPILQWWYPL